MDIGYCLGVYKKMGHTSCCGLEYLLYRTFQFYEIYPQIMEPVPQLTWSHYRILITIKDEEKRREYERLVIESNLNS